METSSVCPRCGRPLDSGAKFCSECGTDVTPVVGAAPTAHLAATEVRSNVIDVLREATVGEFELLRELGRGGMALVYLAHDLQLNRKVAIKVMSPTITSDESMAERFVREAQTAAQLSHPNIIPVYSVKHTSQVTFFVMKFIAGRSLDDIMDELGAMPIEMVTAILTQVAGALGYGHKRGVVHRDVKPGNVMIDDEGWAIVTDFGIAKVDTAEGLTQTGAAIGTPTYMSPEQCTAKSVGGASDQYSLGVMAYQMLTGDKPFDGDSVMAIMYSHVHEAPPDVASRRTDCPSMLRHTIMKMLEKKPEDRFPDMEAVITAVGASPLKHDDPVRTQMMTLAASGFSAKLLDQVKTPRSPIPLEARSAAATPRGAPPSKPLASAPVSVPRSQVAGTPQSRMTQATAPRSRTGAIVGAVIGIAAVVAVLVWAPWRGNEAPPVTTPATSPDVGAAPRPPPDPVALIAALDVVSPSQRLEVGDDLMLSARVTDSTGAPISVDVSWSSSDQRIATVGSDGQVNGIGAGTVIITARTGTHSQRLTLTVESPPPDAPPPARVATVTISPSAATIEVRERVQLSAVARDRGGTVLRGRRVTWRSSDERIAQVLSDGSVTGRAPGTARITASRQDGEDAITVTVTEVPVTRVTMTPATATLDVGQRVEVQARALDNGGNVLSRPLQWVSDDNSVVRVANGVVTAVGPGSATVTASSGGQSAGARIIVRADVPPPTDPQPPAGPTEAESRVQISELVNRFARALESRDISRIREVAPDLAPQTASRFRDFITQVAEIQVTLDVTDIRLSGNSATASIDGRYEFRIDGPRQTQEPSFVATFGLRDGGWTMTDITGR